VLAGLTVGAPPDQINPYGQNWGLTAFSPQALRGSGCAPFLATLRAAMRHAGGVRIDHVMGLTRLWLIPEGAAPTEGAYLTYPLDDLLRLIAIESQRHKAIVIGEDLGTVPDGFRQKLDGAGISGLRVLWFEHDGTGFRLPAAWSEDSVAMTSTHDLATVAGWWTGRDLETRARIGWEADTVTRAKDRQDLWHAFREAGVAPADDAPADPAPVVDAAVDFVARTPSRLALVPLEDLLGLEEQPNLPGTIDQHPNWRRRYGPPADRMFDDPDVAARARALTRRKP
jgi:4-alpha-glucanotransferase